MDKINWINGQSGGTPLSAENLNQMQDNIEEAILNMHPVGSIYMSVNNINPSTLFGGTWEPWGSGKVPVGVDTSDTDFDTVEKTGGEATHILTAYEIPAHTHGVGIANNCNQIYPTGSNAGNGSGRWTFDSSNNGYPVIATSTGGSQAHNNLQPYITCYMWKRTA